MMQEPTPMLPEKATTVHELMERYPPPYRLAGDLAIFPMLVNAARAAAWAGMPVVGALGSAPLFLVAARYYGAEYGEARTPLSFRLSGSDFYREIACVLFTGVLPGFSFGFPRLWVDSCDPTPLELGWHYGFPKSPATIAFRQDEGMIEVSASDERGAIFSARSRQRVSVPARLATALAFGDGIFPHTGLRARLRLDRASRASLLLVQRWELPRLDTGGVGGRARLGLWLEGVTLLLGRPEKLNWHGRGDASVLL